MIKYLVLLIFSFEVFAAKQVAQVKLMRGEVMANKQPLSVNAWIDEGADIQTGDKSFVKLEFIDKSQLNLGPRSQIKIQSYTGESAGVIDFIKGKIRAQVTKENPAMKNKTGSKFMILTKSAVVGVRGTDFMVTATKDKTAVVLFEGVVAFNTYTGKHNVDANRLDQIIDEGVQMQPGEFSVAQDGKSQPTLPAALNVDQLEKLESNTNFDNERSPSSASAQDVTRSMVPKGLPGSLVSNTNDSVGATLSASQGRGFDSASMGFVKGDVVRPANGSFLHLDSGVVIPPASDAIFDSVSNTFISSSENGVILPNGSYAPPSNVEISDEGQITVSSTGPDGSVVKTQIKEISPVVDGTGSFNSVTQASSFSNPGMNLLPQTPIGGIQGVNDPQRDLVPGGFTKVNFHVKE